MEVALCVSPHPRPPSHSSQGVAEGHGRTTGFKADSFRSGPYMEQEGGGPGSFFLTGGEGVEGGSVLGQGKHLPLLISFYTPFPSVPVLPKTVVPQGAHFSTSWRSVPPPETHHTPYLSPLPLPHR